jgi:hypothetical protein
MKTYKSINLILNLLLTASLLAYLSGCNEDDYLENTNKSVLTDETQWKSESNADIYLNDIYNNLHDFYDYCPENLDNFTDDNDAGFYYTSWNWKQGIVDPSSTNYTIWGGKTGPACLDRLNWAAAYSSIRKCNLFLEQINSHKANFTEVWFNKRVDEVRFLRTFFYCGLWMHLGGLPIITEVQIRSSDSTELYRTRNTFEETVTFMRSELDTIVKNGNLVVKYNSGDPNAGRVTLGAVLMLKGWIELYAASPAFNAPTPASGDDPNKVAGYNNYDLNRWKEAATSFKTFIDNYGNTYKLFSDPEKIWTEENEYNSEVIWDRQYVTDVIPSWYETHGGPVWINGVYYTWGNYDPTQELVDEFAMANGKTITDPTSGYDPQHPYINREPRFYNWIVYDGAPYKMDWMSKQDTIYTRIDKVRPSKNQIDFGNDDVSNTGYYFKKKLNPKVIPGSNASGANFIYYRYAEVLLGYAEAQNEASGPDVSVYNAINEIRRRGGISDLPMGLSKEEMRQAIRHERRVELCFENKRFYDIIRWKIAMDVMNVDKHGMKITNSSPNDNKGNWVYEPIPLNHPHVFTQKMYLNPIPLQVIAQNPKLVQNPGY